MRIREKRNRERERATERETYRERLKKNRERKDCKVGQLIETEKARKI